ncbi:unnamed protein product [Ectocarpus sp. CCAP 1310/34]|nr:unnamed protein product [Ectocarpus sp. CCAP 1310/34]
MLLSPAGALPVILVLGGTLGLQQKRHRSPVFERGTSTAFIPCNMDVLPQLCAAARLHGDSCWEKTQTPQPQGWRVTRGGCSFAAHSSSSSATEDELSEGSSHRRQARNSEKNRAGRNNRRSSLEPPQQSPPLEVLHQNEHFAVVSKPPGMHCHRPEFGSRDPDFVMQKARDQLGRRVFLPHRLDRATSGCLLVGFSSHAAKVLHQTLAQPDSSKTYLAIVRGSGSAFVGKGWFTVDRPIKDEKKILREASTRFLFVRGGNDPDPRCCFVLAQPSTGRFHQIRRHLNGLSHPIVGDSVHGDCRFNREVAGHRNSAPAGRLMLHCLRLSLPTLPDVGSQALKSATGRILSPDKDTMTNDYCGSKRKSERGHNARAGQERGERPSRKREDGHGNTTGVDGREARASGSVSEEVQGPVETEKAASNTGDPYPKPRSEFDSARTPPASAPRQEISTEPFVPTLAEISAAISPSVGKKESSTRGCRPRGIDGEAQEDLVEEGFHVYAEPPDDMMEFLRGMSWWEEGLF